MNDGRQSRVNTPTRVGIIGHGFIGRQHLRSWAEIGVELHIFSLSALGGVSNEFDVASHPDADSLIKAVDVVDICTPSHSHAELAVRAARLGRHVICEKPIALTLEDAEAMLQAARTHERRLLVAQVVRYFPEYRALRRAVNSGAVGDVAVVRLARETFPPSRPVHDWLFDAALSGGIIGDLMIHDIDYAIWLAGPVRRVYAKTMRIVSEFEDHAYAILTHESGVLTHLTASWAQVPPRFRTRIEIAGQQGLLVFDSDASRTLSPQFRDAAGSGSRSAVGLPDTTSGHNDPFTAELRDFLDCIEQGVEPQVTAQDGVAALRVALAANQSSRTGQPVELGEDDYA